MYRTVFFAALLAPAVALAAGSNHKSSAPKSSKTTQECKNGQIWDKKTKACVDAKNSLLNDDTLFDAVREFAYAGQYLNAQNALIAISDQSDDRVLTYWGFTHRKLGNVDLGMAFYRSALAANPKNILARSYMGQALVEMGDRRAALKQLKEIRRHGGKNTWAEASLQQAIQTGSGFGY